MFTVTDRPVLPGHVIDAVTHPGAGAVDLFLGVVRDNSEGRTVTRLEYEAYEPMAVQEMKRIAAEITRTLPGVRLAAVHRVGSLAVGEIAVVCAASSVHRSEAFSACRRLIDQIKARVPIWKREWGADGAHWVNWCDARCGASHGEYHVRGSDGTEGSARARAVRIVTLTVSDTRTAESDESGFVLRHGLAGAGFTLVRHGIVPDEPERVRAEIVRAIESREADAVICTGGTGIAPRDQTYEALILLFEKTLDGFGEAFRRISWDQVGPFAVLSRAVAGTYRGGIIMALPGSPRAVTLGVTEIIVPVLGHAVALVRR